MKLNLLEAMRKKQKQPQSQVDTADADPFTSAFQSQIFGNDVKAPAVRQGQAQPPAQQADTPPLRRASRSRTQDAMSNVEVSDEMKDKYATIRDLNLNDVISDEDAARNAGADQEADIPTEVDITTLPAIINKEIAAAGETEPEWHQVKHLPGYLAKGIRAMGRQVFSTFTKTPIEDIQVIANLGGRGPNELRELNAVAGWLKKNAKHNTTGEMDFKKSIGDYDAEFAMFTAKDFTFLVVTDFAGKYIYSWPTSDEKKAIEGANLGIKQEFQRRLGRE